MSKQIPNNHDRIDASPVLHLDTSSSGSLPAPQLMTLAEAAAFLTVSQSAVRRLQQARRLPFVKVGGSLRFLSRDLISYLEQRRVRPLDR